jgi:uncharacterized protein YjbI with pentapeptide repeats
MSRVLLVTLLSAAALALGVPEGSPDNQRMNTFIAPIVAACGNNPFAANAAQDCCSWSGVECNGDARVTAIDWSQYGYGCPNTPQSPVNIDLTLIPPMVTMLDMSRNAYTRTFFWFAGQIRFSPMSVVRKVLLGGNQFTSVDLTTLPPQLIWLDVSQNSIASPGILTKLPATLMYLYMHENLFTGSMDLSQLPPLLWALTVHHNQYTSVTVPAALPHAFGDVFDISFNKVRAFICRGVINATTVDLSNNQLPFAAIRWSLFPRVRVMRLDYNKLTSIPLADLPPSLSELTASHNAIASVALAGGNPSLVGLDLSFNQIAALEWGALPVGLQSLNVDHNALTAVDLTHLPVNLTSIGGTEYGYSFSFTSNRISSVVFPTAFSSNRVPGIDLSGQLLATFDIAALPLSVTRISLAGNQLTSVELSATSPIEELYLDNNKLSAIDWALLPSKLRILTLQHNSLSYADLSALPSTLVAFPTYGTISMANNTLTTVKLTGALPNGITDVDLSRQRLTKVELSGANIGMFSLNLGENQLSSLAFNLLPASLTVLNISVNLFSSVDLTGAPKQLQTLTASLNVIAAVTFDANGGLKHADFSKNRFPSFDMAGTPPSLQNLDLCNNNIKSFVPASSSVVDLRLSNNPLGTLDYAALPVGLVTLELRNCRLSGPFNWGSRFVNMLYLDISLNAFSGPVDFSSAPPSVRELLMSGNSFSGTLDVTKIPVTTSTLWLAYNQLTGSIAFEQLFPAVVTLSHNALSGTISGFAPNKYLDVSHNLFSGSVDFTYAPEILYLNNNQLSGQVKLDDCHLLSVLDLSMNRFSGTPDLKNFYGDSVNFTGTGICGTTRAPTSCDHFVAPQCKLSPPPSNEWGCILECQPC